MLKGKSSAMTGQFTNATLTEKSPKNCLTKSLQENGFMNNGNTVYVNGLTGKFFKCQVFSGICYYMALRHLSEEKVQLRSRGTNNMMTGQPVGGKAKVVVSDSEKWNVIPLYLMLLPLY